MKLYNEKTLGPVSVLLVLSSVIIFRETKHETYINKSHGKSGRNDPDRTGQPMTRGVKDFTPVFGTPLQAS